MTWLTVMEYICYKCPRICSTCRKHFPAFPRSWLVTGFVTGLIRWVSLVEQELLTLPQHLSSPPVCSGVRVTRSLVLYVCFVDRCLYFFVWPLFCLFFDIRILITHFASSISSYICITIISLFILQLTWSITHANPVSFNRQINSHDTT